MAMMIVCRIRARRELRLNRIFRDQRNPLDMFDDFELFQKFRFRRHHILLLTDELHDVLEHPNRRGALLPVMQVMLTLRFYATGCFHSLDADLFGVHQTTASRTITRVTDAFLLHVRLWIKMPTQREADENKQSFFRRHGFPNTIGCVDGTHVKIQAPTVNEYEFVNRKNYHSINVQVMCDAKMQFINVVARWPGSVHDARILRQSEVFMAMESPRKPLTGFILGDSGYMLREWLMTPILNPRNDAEQRYNNAQSSARSAIERCIGVAKRRWHCLQTGLRVSPEKACKIITVCFMLHNRATGLGLDAPEDDDVVEAEGGEEQNEAGAAGVELHTERARLNAGKGVRNNIIQQFFRE